MSAIVIPREIQSGNALAYSHWRLRMRDRSAWVAYFKSGLASHITPATDHRTVTVTAYRKRLVDEDNLSSGFKHGRDAMVRCGLLVDDTREFCTFIYDDCRLLSQLPPEIIAVFGRVPVTVIEIADTIPAPKEKNDAST